MMDAKQVDRFIQAMERIAAAVERLGAKEKTFTASDNADFLAQADWERATETALKPYNEPARMGAACGNCGQPSFICKGKCRTEPPRTCGECKKWPFTLPAHPVWRQQYCCGNRYVEKYYKACPDFQPREVTP